MEVLRFGYRLPFLSASPLSGAPLPMPSYSPTSIKGAALEEVTLALVAKGAVELAPLPSPGFYSRLFVVWKTSGSWRPVIDLSRLNRFVDTSHFQMETIQSVLLSVRQGDWMASIDLKEAYLQVPVHPSSRHLLRFVFRGKVYQFKALCFGLSTAPQVFTRVMAPVSAILHSMGIRMRRYLDDWLVQSSSRDSLVRDLRTVLGQSPEIQPCAFPDRPVSGSRDRLHIFQGFSVAGSNLQAAINCRRISVLRLASREFVALASGRPFFAGSPSAWRASEDAVSPTLPPPIVGSVGPSGSSPGVLGLSSGPPVVAPPSSPLFRGVSLPGVSRPTLLVRRLGRGLGSTSRASGRFRPVGLRSSRSFHQRQGTVGRPSGSSPVPVFSAGNDSRSILRQHHGGGVPPEGGRHEVSSPQLLGSGDIALDGVSLHTPGSTVSSGLSECPGGRSVSPSPAPSFRVVSTQGRVSVFEKTLAGPNRLICNLRQSPLFNLLLSSPRSGVSGHGRIPAVLGRSTGLCFSASVPHSQGSGQAPCVLGDGAHTSGSTLGSASVVRGSSPAVAGPSCSSAFQARPSAPASVSASLPGSPSAQASCLETLQRFTRAAGFSSAVAIQSSLARRPSSRSLYQHRWSVYRSWCREQGHSVSRPTLAKIADFLYWLRFTKGLSVSSLRGYRSALSAVFRFHLPSLSSDPVLRDLLRSFRLSSAERIMRPPAWDLSKVLQYLVTSAFEPLSQASFRALTLKTLFLLALATAKRVGELQALSAVVTFVGADACLSYIPQFVAKSESLTRSIPRSFLVKSLADFAAGLDTDLLLCPVRALRLYLPRARSLSPGRHRLFVSPRRPSRAMSKNAVSFFLREIISAAGAARPHVGSLRAHDVRSVSTSVAFHRNWSVSSVLESATWASSSVFSSFYLRDIQHEFDGLLSLGPFVAAGTRIG